jgi:type IV pilus assembly protein PilQ
MTMVRVLFLVLVLTGRVALVTAQAAPDTTAPAGRFDRSRLPEGAGAVLRDLDVRGADLRDVLRAVAAQYGLNVSVDDRIERTVTFRLAALPVLDALVFLCDKHGLILEQEGAILHIRQPEVLPPKPAVRVADGRLYADLAGVDIHVAARALAEAGGTPIVVRTDAAGTVSGFLEGAPFASGLRALMESNGYTIREVDGIYAVDRGAGLATEASAGGMWVDVQEGRIALDLRDAPIADVLRALADRLGIDLIAYAQPEGQITARVAGLTVEEALTYLLRSTNLAYRREGEVYIVGDRKRDSVAASRLIPLRHIHPEGLADRLPANLREGASFQVIAEQNALLVTAPQDVLSEVEGVLAQLDAPTPQILIEVLVVDFETNDLSQLGLTFGRDGAAEPAPERYAFGAGGDQAGGVEVSGGARTAERYVNALADLLGVGSIGRLPDDFYFRIHALEREGRATVRSRPQIATLNGHTAHISVGTTQYYILRTLIPYSTPGQVNEAEHFERVEANVSLEITPWVGASGEVTAEIRPTFATPVGVLDPRVPPTINNRLVETTVRLRDGETVAIGGLIQESASEAYNKVPLLGDIPLVGRLFRNRRQDSHRSELVIFLTPHVFFGDEASGGLPGKLQGEEGRIDLGNGGRP